MERECVLCCYTVLYVPGGMNPLLSCHFILFFLYSHPAPSSPLHYVPSIVDEEIEAQRHQVPYPDLVAREHQHSNPGLADSEPQLLSQLSQTGCF